MTRPLLALNWKLNKGPAEAGRWAHHLLGRLPAELPADLAVMAPFVSLQAVADALNLSKVAWGAQDVSEHTTGAYTGEVSAPMLAEICCKYAIVGHSERRQYHAESDEVVGRKARAAQDAGITPILCVGESLDIREAGNAVTHTVRQLEVALADTKVAKPEDLVIAYEPIWAIGTGKTATPDDAEQMGVAMRGFVNQRYGEQTAAGIRLLYGGSVKPDNIAALCSRKDVDGALVGGASLDLDSVIAMLNALA